MISEVLPEYWEQIKTVPWQAQSKVHFSTKDIRAALPRLTESDKLYRNTCFCFFIDGLDEYDATAQKDQKAIAELLCVWARTMRKTVKFCISSREYNVFMNAFSAAPRLRLHELTWRDMRKYVHDKLSHIEESENLKFIDYNIPDKAKGIFL
jgi:hypothetical protein